MDESLLFKNDGVSILTHGKDGFGIIKDWLRKKGFGNSPGPTAVQRNLVLGLTKINSDFNLNPPIDLLYKQVVALSSPKTVDWFFRQAYGDRKIIVGPNFTAEEFGEINKKYPQVYKFLSPCEGVKMTLEYYGLPKERISIWPVGINTDLYADFSAYSKQTDVLIYFKSRKQQELAEVKKLLSEHGQTYRILEYGKYSSEDFLHLLQTCRYAVVLDHTESQGIALQSIMAANLPMFVFDQIYQGNSPLIEVKENYTSTSVPYWSDACGVKVPTDIYSKSRHQYYKIPQTAALFKQFLGKLSLYHPRKFIFENLELGGQAEKLLKLFS